MKEHPSVYHGTAYSIPEQQKRENLDQCRPAPSPVQAITVTDRAACARRGTVCSSGRAIPSRRGRDPAWTAPMLSFDDPALEHQWLAASPPLFLASDRAMVALNLLFNAAFVMKAAGVHVQELPSLTLLLAKDILVSGVSVVAPAMAPALFAQHRVPLVTLVRLFRAVMGPPRIYPRGCLPEEALSLWMFSSGSGSLLLAGMVLPTHLHVLVQAFALATVAPKTARICRCVGLGALGEWYARLASAHRRRGASPLCDWLPSRPTAGHGGSCAPVLLAAVTAKVLVATTLLSLAVEAALRARFLALLPGKNAELRRLGAKFTAAALALLSLLPVTWEAAVVACRWALGGLPARPALEAAVVVTSVGLQLVMRGWLYLVLLLLVANPLLLFWERRWLRRPAAQRDLQRQGEGQPWRGLGLRLSAAAGEGLPGEPSSSPGARPPPKRDDNRSGGF